MSRGGVHSVRISDLRRQKRTATDYDRTRVLARASAARKRGKRKKAIELYRRVLADEPDNLELHRKLGPLLAETRQRRQALVHFGRAAQGFADRGFTDKAVGLCRQAAGFYPAEVAIWEAIAELQLRRERRADAVGALLEGRRNMRRRKLRPQAIRLLERVRAIDPGLLDPQLDLAWLLARSGRRVDACAGLDALASRHRGRARRRALRTRLRISPSPRALWRCLAAHLGA